MRETRREKKHTREESGVKMMREQEVIFTGQAVPRIAGTHQKLGGKHGEDASSGCPEGTNSADNLLTDLWPPKL